MWATRYAPHRAPAPCLARVRHAPGHALPPPLPSPPPCGLSSLQVCILAGDFLLSKAAVELSLLESSVVTEIVARGLEAICEGSMRAFKYDTHA